MNEWFPREACSVLAAPILWCCAATSSATELELLLDAKALDGDCIVETIPEAQAAENVDFRLTVAIDATANTVTGVSLERCEGTTLGDPMLIDEGGYPIAVDAGEAGSDAIEFAVTTEVLDAEDAASLIAIANSSFDLLVAGFQVVFADGFEGVLVSKSAGIVIDGQVDDWLGIEPQLDPVGDSTGAAPGSDIVALFSAAAGDDLFFRVDIVDVENDAPTASASDAETTEDTPVAVTLSANDPDGDPLTFSIENDPTNGVLDAITNPSNSRAEVTYTPADDFDGEDSFTFSVQDPAGLESSATVSITVNSLPDAPTAVASSASTNEDEAIEIVLTGFDPDADALTFLIETTPTLGVLGAVTPLSSESASVVFTPSEDLNGDDFLTFTVSDGVTTSPPATVDISITPVNDPPSLTGNVMLTIEENDRGRFGYTGSDVDGDPLTFSVRGTDGEQFTISPAGFLGLIEQPDFEAPLDADENNVYRATVVLSDGDLEAELPVTLTVIAIDEPPVIISDGGDDDVDLEVDEGKTQVTRVTALDPERGVVSYLIDGGADAGAFELDAETGRLTFAGRTDFEAPDDSDNDGVYELEVIARDASGLDDRQAFRIALADAPLAFSATAASSYSAMCSPTGEINTDSLVLVFDEMDDLGYGFSSTEDRFPFDVWATNTSVLAAERFASPGSRRSQISVSPLAVVDNPDQNLLARRNFDADSFEDEFEFQLADSDILRFDFCVPSKNVDWSLQLLVNSVTSGPDGEPEVRQAAVASLNASQLPLPDVYPSRDGQFYVIAVSQSAESVEDLRQAYRNGMQSELVDVIVHLKIPELNLPAGTTPRFTLRRLWSEKPGRASEPALAREGITVGGRFRRNDPVEADPAPSPSSPPHSSLVANAQGDFDDLVDAVVAEIERTQGARLVSDQPLVAENGTESSTSVAVNSFEGGATCLAEEVDCAFDDLDALYLWPGDSVDLDAADDFYVVVGLDYTRLTGLGGPMADSVTVGAYIVDTGVEGLFQPFAEVGTDNYRLQPLNGFLGDATLSGNVDALVPNAFAVHIGRLCDRFNLAEVCLNRDIVNVGERFVPLVKLIQNPVTGIRPDATQVVAPRLLRFEIER